MRSLAMRIVSQFPAELRRMIEAEDRLTAAGFAGEADMAFDHDLDALVDLVARSSAVDREWEEVVDAISEATEIQRGRDAWRARSEARRQRAAATCSGCMGGEGAR